MDELNKDLFEALMEAASSAITGKTVKVFLRQPMYEDLAGEVYLGADGEHVIDLLPGEPSKCYLTWLHECAHLILGHLSDAAPRILPPELNEAFLKEGALIKLPEERWKEHSTDPRELEADSVAHALDDFARRKAFERFGDSSIKNRLLILSYTTYEEESHDQT